MLIWKHLNYLWTSYSFGGEELAAFSPHPPTPGQPTSAKMMIAELPLLSVFINFGLFQVTGIRAKFSSATCLDKMTVSLACSVFPALYWFLRSCLSLVSEGEFCLLPTTGLSEKPELEFPEAPWAGKCWGTETPACNGQSLSSDSASWSLYSLGQVLELFGLYFFIC